MQRCVRSFGGPEDHGGCVNSLHFCAGHIVSQSGRSNHIHIWTIGGVRLCTIETNGEVAAMTTSANQLVFYRRTFNNADSSLNVFDIPSGERVLSVEPSWSAELVDSTDLLLVGEWLLVACKINVDAADENDEAEGQAGIYVLNQSDLVQESLFHGKVESIIGLNDGGDIAVLGRDGTINIMNVENGTLVPLRSFMHPHPTSAFAEPILFATESLIYVIPSSAEELNAIIVIDANNGERVRTLLFPERDPFTDTGFYPWALTSNGREVICGFNVGHRDKRSMSTIKAFPT